MVISLQNYFDTEILYFTLKLSYFNMQTPF